MARRRKSFGVLTHRGASSYSKRSREREFSIKVGVHRNIGASHAKQFCAEAWIPKHGRHHRPGGLRVGQRACASTPTTATKRALRLLLARNWYGRR